MLVRDADSIPIWCHISLCTYAKVLRLTAFILVTRQLHTLKLCLDFFFCRGGGGDKILENMYTYRRDGYLEFLGQLRRGGRGQIWDFQRGQTRV